MRIFSCMDNRVHLDRELIAGSKVAKASQDSNQASSASEYDDIEPPDNLKARSIKGGAVTLFAQAISYCITICSVAILARLLTPEDYGTVAMVTALTGFVSLFRDLGLSGATIQCCNISHDQKSALFWINTCLGIIIMLIIVVSAPAIAWFYGKPQLLLVTVAISFTSLLSSIGTQHGALLTREMRFTVLAIIQATALLAGFLAAVFVALSGGKYWALVVNNIIIALWTSAGQWLASDFRPSWPKRGTSVRSFIHFGVNVVGFDLAYYFHDNMDKILIGRVWGGHQLGLYSKAYSILMMPLSILRYPLNRVAFPAMSRLKDDPVRFRSYFVKYCSVLAFASMPLVTILYLNAESIIKLILGDRWLGAVELFRILAVAGFIQSVASLRTTVIMSSGHGSRLSRWGFCNALASVAAFICGLPWGAKGVSIAYCIVSYMILHPSLMYAFRNTPVRTNDFYHSVSMPCAASIMMSILYILTVEYMPELPEIVLLIISIPYCIIIYLILFYFLPGGKKSLLEYTNYLSIIFKRHA